MSIQQELVFGIKKLYPSVVVKKVDSGNFVDIHFPEINEKKGTHLFFNTSGNKIKLGFYCRDEEFVQSALIKTDVLEKYSQGVRLRANPEFDTVEEAVNPPALILSKRQFLVRILFGA